MQQVVVHRRLVFSVFVVSLRLSSKGQAYLVAIHSLNEKLREARRLGRSFAV